MSRGGAVVQSLIGDSCLVFELTGAVLFRFTNVAGAGNAVLSGVFFGGGSTAGEATPSGTDPVHQGAWQGTYGPDGYTVADTPSNLASLPSYATVAFSGQTPYVWNASTTDLRAVQQPGMSSRLASCWYSNTSFTVDVDLTDGKSHQVALYLLDWDVADRDERVDVVDEASGATLQSDTVTGFSGGEYLVFEVTGNVLFRFTNLGGLNAVLSGVFFGGRAATTGSRYVYDVFGDRVEADDVAGGVTTVTRFGYDGSNVWADLNGSDALVARYVRPDGEDALAARVSAAGSAVAWYLTDRQGSVRALTNAAGAVQDQSTYDAFGNLLSETNAAYGDRYKYTGREWDAADRLQYNRARYYDPATGSWTSQDPAGFDAGDDDLYRYVQNGPTDGLDPSGMFDVGAFADYIRAQDAVSSYRRGVHAIGDNKGVDARSYDVPWFFSGWTSNQNYAWSGRTLLIRSTLSTEQAAEVYYKAVYDKYNPYGNPKGLVAGHGVMPDLSPKDAEKIGIIGAGVADGMIDVMKANPAQAAVPAVEAITNPAKHFGLSTGPADPAVESLSGKEKILAAVKIGFTDGIIAEEFRDQVGRLLDPTNAAIVAASATALAGLHFIPGAGPVLDTVVGGLGVLMFGKSAVEVSHNLLKFVYLAANARNNDDLVNSAGALAETAVEAGVKLGTAALVRQFGKTFCFLAGTVVDGESGPTVIESVERGDAVWAYDVRNGSWGVRRVDEQWGHRHEGDVYDIRVRGEVISATDRHPFWVVAGPGLATRRVPEHIPPEERDLDTPSGRWVAADELRVGDVLLARDGARAEVEGVAVRTGIFFVYNFYVDGVHTYAVGRAGVVVHNAGATDDFRNKLSDKLAQVRAKLKRGAKAAAPKVGETASTATGKSIHKEIADARKASGEFDLVQSPIKDKAGNPILVSKRVDLKAGTPQPGSPLQEAVPDAVSFKRKLILDDKPLGRPIAKDRQEIIRFIKAYEQREGNLPDVIGITRYDPKTGQQLLTELYSPKDFLP